MRKPAALRAHITAATPELQRDPDKLAVYVNAGKIVAAAAGSLSFEYRYTLTLTVLDYAGHPDAILVPMLAWLQRHQVELFDNPDTREKAIRFEAEFLNKETIDLTIEVDLSERVIVKAVPAPAPPAPGQPDPLPPTTATRYTIEHVGEQPRPGTFDQREHYSLWLHDQLLAEWDHDPGIVPAG